jgi:hypothetical protein
MILSFQWRLLVQNAESGCAEQGIYQTARTHWAKASIQVEQHYFCKDLLMEKGINPETLHGGCLGNPGTYSSTTLKATGSKTGRYGMVSLWFSISSIRYYNPPTIVLCFYNHLIDGYI